MAIAREIEELGRRISSCGATVGICGMGYVGLPLAAAAARKGYVTIGFDIDRAKVAALNSGASYIDAVSSEDLLRLRDAQKFRASFDMAELSACDVIAICVPTPLSKHRDPDLSFVERMSESIAASLVKGKLIIVESTTYPGTTVEVVKPILERSGLRCGEDFLLAYSPEREDPGNKTFGTSSIPKIVAGCDSIAADFVGRFYGSFVAQVVPVSSTQTAEAVKLTENIFRAVNIALVNELKIIYSAMGIDVWEVIDAAKTKPFGFMPFYPGPGLGGHCIPIDPFYLTWKAREYELSTRLIELAGEINVSMPRYVIEHLAAALDRHQSVALSSAQVLIVGISYKKNVADMRESPSLQLLELLEDRNARVAYYDPLVEYIPMTREHAQLAGRKSIDLAATDLSKFNVVLIATDHDAIDYDLIARSARMVVDTRNVFARKGLQPDIVVKA